MVRIIQSLLMLIRNDLYLKTEKSSHLRCPPILKKMTKFFRTLSELKFQVHFQKETWKREKLWLYQLEKEPYFPYGKRVQVKIEKE